jgi:hypothetical protein
MLLHSGPLGLAHCLLYVEALPFGCISSEDHELMQLKTVRESSSCAQTPSFGHSAVNSSPQVALVHLAENAITAHNKTVRLYVLPTEQELIPEY